jgi:hypothetical protein
MQQTLPVPPAFRISNTLPSAEQPQDEHQADNRGNPRRTIVPQAELDPLRGGLEGLRQPRAHAARASIFSERLREHDRHHLDLLDYRRFEGRQAQAYHLRVTRAIGAFVLVAGTVGCSGRGPAGPETAVTLGHSQGFLCSATAAGLQLPACARESISQNQATVRVHTSQEGTLRLIAIVRSFDYQEYFRPTLVCNAAPAGWTPTAVREQAQPEWFVPLMGPSRPATWMEFVAPVTANAFCDVDISFDLRSPPYSPYDVTIVLDPR